MNLIVVRLELFCEFVWLCLLLWVLNLDPWRERVLEVRWSFLSPESRLHYFGFEGILFEVFGCEERLVGFRWIWRIKRLSEYISRRDSPEEIFHPLILLLFESLLHVLNIVKYDKDDIDTINLAISENDHLLI